MRQLFAIIAGLVVAVLIIFMALMIREGLYPQPRDLDYSNKIQVSDWMDALPTTVFWIAAISHGLAAFCAGFISSLTSGSNRMVNGIISACVIFVMVLIYLFTYYFPTWFVLTDTIATSLLGFAGVVTGSQRIVS
ncbi:MAG: hypothetical protein IPM42_00060 [Saprospiraceae bacterium]|nr:hypothetical protein [Saprospiraceae bacterium]